jgi:hypothetical protein
VDSFGGGKDQGASQLAVVASLPMPLGLFSEARSPEACKAWPLDALIVQPARGGCVAETDDSHMQFQGTRAGAKSE